MFHCLFWQQNITFDSLKANRLKNKKTKHYELITSLKTHMNQLVILIVRPICNTCSNVKKRTESN